MIDYLSPDESTRLQELREGDVFAQDALTQVDRILGSRRFERVQQRGRDFLSYIVAQVLLGQSEQIKETTIAVAVFGEPADFDPAESAKVRVAGCDLRQRLIAYAEGEGKADPITILLPSHTFVPSISDRQDTIEIAEFENWNPAAEQDHLRRAWIGEVVHLLHEAGFRITERPARFPALEGRRYVLRGSLACSDRTIRVTASLADPALGRVVCTQSLEDHRDAILKLARTAAEALQAGLRCARPEGAPVRSRRTP
ncbi:MAG: hypothetical protein AB7P22_20270 [Vicinamibacterales bacterium]